MRELDILATPASADYELIDSGDGERLERFGAYTLSRPDPQALWRKNLPESEWKKAHGRFVRMESAGEGKGSWILKKGMPERWEIALGGLKFYIRPTPFKHTGVFPEQTGNWQWIADLISKSERTGIEVLNLFGYTGGATLALAKAGAKVVHVDGSKSAVSWASDNATLSGLSNKPIRWILDDARAFVRREAKRGRKYDGIVMDPPSFGRGPKGQVWKIEEDLLPLIDECTAILSDRPLFFLMNGYAAGYSALAYGNSLSPLLNKHVGTVETGELAIEETSGKSQKRLLPCGIYARWRS